MKNIITSFIIILFFAQIGSANTITDSLKITGDELEIKLITIGPGKELTAWWGHTAIVVENSITGESKFYNYGLFSFEEENFFTNFAMGRLIFSVGAWRTSIALNYYQEQDRDIDIQIVNLSQTKKQQIKKFLENNVKPENRRYLYDHYYDNCSTRIRDIFTNATEGQLLEVVKQPGRKTLREHTRRHTYHSPVMDFILIYLMNDTIDKPILIENEMFLPSEMEKVLDNFTYRDENGSEQTFVKEKIIFHKSSTIEKVPETAPAHWPYTLILGIIFSTLAVLIACFPEQKQRLQKNLFGILNILFGFIFGVLGTVLFFMSLFTDHTVTYYNENLFLANPITLVLLPLGFLFTINKLKSVKWIFRTWLILLTLAALLLILKFFPAFDQDNWQAITLIIPIILGSTISALLMNNKEHPNRE